MTTYHKVQTYIPESHLELLKTKLNDVITPLFAHYDFVFSWYPVNGSWRALPGSQPYQGEVGKIETAQEIKLEFTVLENDLLNVFAAIKSVHPYEQPVIESYEVCLNLKSN